MALHVQSTHHCGPLVLIVEDDPLIALELEDLVTCGGYSVLGPAHSVASALTLLGSASPDAAILDFNLNGENVTPVATVLSHRCVPFLLASANLGPFDEAVLTLARNLGKPTDRLELLSELEKMTAHGIC